MIRNALTGMIATSFYEPRGPAYDDLLNQFQAMNKTEYPIDSPTPLSGFQYIYDSVYLLARAFDQMIQNDGFTIDGKLRISLNSMN